MISEALFAKDERLNQLCSVCSERRRKRLVLLLGRICKWTVAIVNVVCNVRRRTIHVLNASLISFGRVTITVDTTVCLLVVLAQHCTQIEAIARNNVQIRMSFELLLCFLKTHRTESFSIQSFLTWHVCKNEQLVAWMREKDEKVNLWLAGVVKWISEILE